MKILFLLFLASNLYAYDSPVSYWQVETSIPEKWKTFLDPNSINFWKEGDYTPPTPLLMAMRDPSPQNIAFYKTYLKRRAGALDTFQRALKKEEIEQVEKIIVAFRSDCSACHQLLTELATYPNIFEKIQLLQIDKGRISLPWPKMHLTEEQANALKVQAVPTVWVKKKGEKMQRLEHPTKLFEEYL